MNTTASRAYLRTRLAIFHARLYDRPELQHLIDLPLEQLMDVLGIDDHPELTSAQRFDSFERAQIQQWLDELSALVRPLNGPARDVLVQWARRYELFNLKAIIRAKLARLPNAEVEKTLFRLPGFLMLDHQKLLNTESAEETLRQLADTSYRRMASQALRRFEKNPDPFLLDATLDQQFYHDLATQVRKLDNIDRDATINLTGRIIDRRNLIWLLRYRFNYRMAPPETLYLLIRNGLKLNLTHLRELVNLEDLPGVLAQLPQSIRDAIGDASDIMTIDARMQNQLGAHCTHVLRHSPSVLAAALAYLVLSFYQMRNLLAVVHARLYGFSDEVLNAALSPVLAVAPR